MPIRSGDAVILLKGILVSVSSTPSPRISASTISYIGHTKSPARLVGNGRPTLSRMNPSHRGFRISCTLRGMMPPFDTSSTIIMSRRSMISVRWPDAAFSRIILIASSCAFGFSRRCSAVAACIFIWSSWFSRIRVSNSVFSLSLRSRCSFSHTSAISVMRSQFCWYWLISPRTFTLPMPKKN